MTAESHERYTLGDEIARGGMGVVRRATDTVLNREVAVKVLAEKYAPDSPAARRFAVEARITGQLQHPNIPAVHDLGTLPDGRPFLAMKLVKGDTLDRLLATWSVGEPPAGSPDPPPALDRGRLLAVFEKVCEAVAFAHSLGIVHRDLKPANVMVGDFGEVQVMDWGLAKVLGERPRVSGPSEDDPDATELHADTEALTQAGSVLGTPAYMPPEQAVGALDLIDPRSDVFGLGGILCAALTGSPPFVGGNAESTRQLAAKGDTAAAFARLEACGADPELVALAKRCLSPDRDERPADAGEVARAVASLRAAADERARQAELDRAAAEARAIEQQKRRRAAQLYGRAIAAVLLAGVAGTAVGLVKSDDARRGETAQRKKAEDAEGVATAAQKDAEAGQKREAGLRADAERSLYLNRVAFAARELALPNAKRARELLALCPPRLRDWEWDYLTGRTRTEERVQNHAAPGQGVGHLVVSPDGKTLVVAAVLSTDPWDARALILDAATLGVRRASGPGGPHGWAPSAFHPDGTRVACGGRWVKVTPGGAATPAYGVHLLSVDGSQPDEVRDGATFLTWSRDGALEAEGRAADRRVVVRETGTGREVFATTPHGGIPYRAEISGDGRWLHVAWSPEITRWGGPGSGEVTWDMRGRRPPQAAVTGSPPGGRFAAGRFRVTVADDRLVVWDAEQNREVGRFEANAGAGRSHVADYRDFDDRPLVAAAGGDGAIRVFDFLTRKRTHTLVGHEAAVEAVQFSPADRRVYSAGADGTVRVWNLGNANPFREYDLDADFSSTASFLDGDRVLVTSRKAGVLDVRTGEFTRLSDHPAEVAAFAPAAGALAVVSRGDAADRHQLTFFDTKSWAQDGLPRPTGGPFPVSPSTAAAAPPRGGAAFLLCPVVTKAARSWKLEARSPAGAVVWEATADDAYIPSAVAVCPDGATVAVNARDGVVLRDAATGRVTGRLLTPETLGAARSAYAVAFDPTGRFVAAGTRSPHAPENSAVVVWDRATLAARVFRGHRAAVTGLAFSPTGTRLASAGRDQTRGLTDELKLWDLETGAEVLSLPGGGHVAFSPSGRRLASFWRNEAGKWVLRVWDAPKE